VRGRERLDPREGVKEGISSFLKKTKNLTKFDDRCKIEILETRCLKEKRGSGIHPTKKKNPETP